jgi:hypothetical protein
MAEPRRLADFTVPITSGLATCRAGMGRLSRARAAALAARLRALDVARRDAEVASRSYFVGGPVSDSEGNTLDA